MLLKKIFLSLAALFITGLTVAQNKTVVSSPDNNIQLSFWLDEQGAPNYSVSYKNKPVILTSSMGFALKQTMTNEALPSIKDNLVITSSVQSEIGRAHV